MKTVSGVFDNADVALRAGEKVREVAGARATVRVHVPGTDGKVVETAILADESSFGPVPFIGIALGLVCAVAVKLIGFPWSYALLGLLSGAISGGLIAWWLTGEAYPRRIYHPRFDGRATYEQEMLARRAVVTAIVHKDAQAESVREVLRTMGGRVVEGFLHEGRLVSNRPLVPSL